MEEVRLVNEAARRRRATGPVPCGCGRPDCPLPPLARALAGAVMAHIHRRRAGDVLPPDLANVVEHFHRQGYCRGRVLAAADHLAGSGRLSVSVEGERVYVAATGPANATAAGGGS